MSDLEGLMGIELRGYMDGTIAVPDRLKIDKKKLRSYLNWALKLHDKGDDQGNLVCLPYFFFFALISYFFPFKGCFHSYGS